MTPDFRKVLKVIANFLTIICTVGESMGSLILKSIQGNDPVNFKTRKYDGTIPKVSYL